MRALIVLSLVTALFLTSCDGGSGDTSTDTGTVADTGSVADAVGELDTAPVADMVADPDANGPARQLVLADLQGRSLTLAWDEAGSATLTLRNDETVLATSHAPLFEVGSVETYNDVRLYDPYPHPQDMGWIPDDLTWHTMTIANAEAVAGEDAWELRLSGEGVTGTLRVALWGDGTFQLDWTAAATDRDLVFFRVNMTAPAGEEYYGLGEFMDQVPQRGRHRAMHMVIDTSQESGYNEAHVPIPFFTGTKGWGLFIEDRHPGEFDMAADDADRIGATFFQREGLRLFFFAADHPLDVPGLYTRVTGAPALPPLWSFAPLQWRDEIYSQEDVLGDAQTMRDLDFPAGGMWIDRPWQTAYGEHIFRPDWYPDAAGMIDELHGMGYRLAVWTVPYLANTLPEYETAEENDYFMPFPAGAGWPRGLNDVRQLDLSSEGARELFAGLLENATSVGVEGYKLDYAETVQLGLKGTRVTPMTFANGETDLTMHRHLYYFYHLPYAESVDNAFLIARSGTYGDQTLTTTIWPGDLCANFAFHGEDLDGEGEDQPHVGGLPAAITAGLSLSVSGYPWYASDTGGYRHERPTKEVLIRWHEYSALHPIMQIGGGSNHRPWDFELGDDGIQYDEETLDACRLYARLHLRLFPYYYALSERAAAHGRPVIRPFGMAFPEDGRHTNWDFAVGDDLLVSPVYRGGETTREVPFPEGRWIDWWDGTAYTGPSTETVDAPLGRLPLFVRSGAIIPMLRPTIDTLAPATLEGIESYTNDPGALYLRIFPDGASSFATHDGTEIAVGEGSALSVVVTPGEAFTSFVVEIDWANRGATATDPSTVAVDGEALTAADAVEAGCNCWSWDADHGLLRAAFEGGTLTAE